MLRYRLQQIHVPSLGRYLVPLPKLGDAQSRALAEDLESRGFSISRAESGRQMASKGAIRVTIEAKLGLAASSADILDALGPSIPSILEAVEGDPAADVSRLYFSFKRSAGTSVVQFFPRMESSREWTCLRRDGLSGLTPDEAAVLRHLLAQVPGSSALDCVTSQPREGSKAIQAGRRQYFKSRISTSEFLSTLRTLESGSEPASYLPRDSILRVKGRVDPSIPQGEVGQWCFAD